MAHSLSANKRIRQSESRNARNRWRKLAMREATSACLDKIAHGTAEEAAAAFRAATKVIDRTAQRGVIHKNQAARRKSRLSARLKAKSAPAAAPAKGAAKPAAKKAK
jgi:small subunit ribosomal protein S20